MRVYLAARYSRLAELQGYADELRDIGYVVDARWLLGDHQTHEGADEVESALSMPIEARTFAEYDFEDVYDSDMLIAFSEEPRTGGASRGGRHVELGLALALNIEVVVVGPRENVFHTLRQVKHFESWGEALNAITRYVES